MGVGVIEGTAVSISLVDIVGTGESDVVGDRPRVTQSFTSFDVTLLPVMVLITYFAPSGRLS